MGDPQKYRTKEEMEEYKLKDPVEVALAKLKSTYKLTEEESNAITERVKKEVEDSVQFAEESPWPDISEVYKDIYIQEDYPFIMD